MLRSLILRSGMRALLEAGGIAHSLLRPPQRRAVILRPSLRALVTIGRQAITPAAPRRRACSGRSAFCMSRTRANRRPSRQHIDESCLDTAAAALKLAGNEMLSFVGTRIVNA